MKAAIAFLICFILAGFLFELGRYAGEYALQKIKRMLDKN